MLIAYLEFKNDSLSKVLEPKISLPMEKRFQSIIIFLSKKRRKYKNLFFPAKRHVFNKTCVRFGQ
jgi:hypothetical protein